MLTQEQENSIESLKNTYECKYQKYTVEFKLKVLDLIKIGFSLHQT